MKVLEFSESDDDDALSQAAWSKGSGSGGGRRSWSDDDSEDGASGGGEEEGDGGKEESEPSGDGEEASGDSGGSEEESGGTSETSATSDPPAPDAARARFWKAHGIRARVREPGDGSCSTSDDGGDAPAAVPSEIVGHRRTGEKGDLEYLVKLDRCTPSHMQWIPAGDVPHTAKRGRLRPCLAVAYCAANPSATRRDLPEPPASSPSHSFFPFDSAADDLRKLATVERRLALRSICAGDARDSAAFTAECLARRPERIAGVEYRRGVPSVLVKWCGLAYAHASWVDGEAFVASHGPALLGRWAAAREPRRFRRKKQRPSRLAPGFARQLAAMVATWDLGRAGGAAAGPELAQLVAATVERWARGSTGVTLPNPHGSLADTAEAAVPARIFSAASAAAVLFFVALHRLRGQGPFLVVNASDSEHAANHWVRAAEEFGPGLHAVSHASTEDGLSFKRVAFFDYSERSRNHRAATSTAGQAHVYSTSLSQLRRDQYLRSLKYTAVVVDE
eukprot:gene13177-20350_t